MPNKFHFCERVMPSLEYEGQQYYRVHGIDRTVVGSRHLFFSSDVEMARDFSTGGLSLDYGEWISTGTLRNSFYLEPLAQLTKIRDLRLFVDYTGALNLKLMCARLGKKAKIFREVQLFSAERTQDLIDIGSPGELPESSRLYWNIEALEGGVCLHDIHFVTHSVPRTDCRLMVLLRTYGRTVDVKGILRQFAEAGQRDYYYGSILDNTHFLLLDTTSDCDSEYREAWQHDLNLEILVSENLGGGGNASHILKLMEESCTGADNAPTELLIMDDDLTISPESLARYFMFCAFRNQEFICSAPILMKSRPTVVWEDGGFWGRLNFHEGGGFNTQRNLFPNLLKHGVQVDGFEGLDAFCPLNPCEYSTFIFFGLSMKAFRKLGYPVALFLRGDDIEYSLRAQNLEIPLITNPNMTAWHEPSHSYAQEYMAILHGVIINLSYSEQDAGFYTRFFEQRLYEHASIDDLVGISIYKDILAELVNEESAVLSDDFQCHYIEKIKEFAAVKMLRIQDTERQHFEKQAKENNVLLVPFVYPEYQKDALKYRSIVVYNQPAKSYREIPPSSPGQRTTLLRMYMDLLIDFENRFGEIRSHWQQRLAHTRDDAYWSAIRERYRPSTRVIFTAHKIPANKSATENKGRHKDDGQAPIVNRTWLGKLRAAVDTGQTKPGIRAGSKNRSKTDVLPDELPIDFDPAAYLHINQDVVDSGIDPADHFLRFGRKEGRRYKLNK